MAMFVVLALESLRQKNCCKFETYISNIVQTSQGWVSRLCGKKKKRGKKSCRVMYVKSIVKNEKKK